MSVAHLHPLALLRERVELVLQVAPAVQLEHGAVRRRRAVERDLLLRARSRGLELLLVRAGDDERRPRDLEALDRLARLRPAALDRGQRDLADVALGREAVEDEAVGRPRPRPRSSARRPPARNTFGVAVRVRPWVEERRHQRVACRSRRGSRASCPSFQQSQIARIARTISRMRAAGWDHGIENRFSMCGLIWLPSPRMNRPLDTACRSYADVGEQHRVPGERDGDAGAELDALRVLAPRASNGKNGSWLVSADQMPL